MIKRLLIAVSAREYTVVLKQPPRKIKAGMAWSPKIG